MSTETEDGGRHMQMSFALQLPRDVMSVPVMRGVLTASLRAVDVDRDCIDDIAVAMTEACTNVLEHSLEDDEYEVVARIVNLDCEIDIIDNGRGFDASGLGRADADESAEGGRGIQLMRALVDSLDFNSVPEHGTVVHMRKRLALMDSSPLQQWRQVRTS